VPNCDFHRCRRPNLMVDFGEQWLHPKGRYDPLAWILHIFPVADL
jgi:hypothetical protein